MKIRKRNNRNKDDLKEQIFHAAKEIFIREGHASTTIRKIASAIGYSPTTIYIYYSSKNDILSELQMEGNRLLAKEMKSLSNISKPFERFKSMGICYLRFAEVHPKFYELMFMVKDMPNCFHANVENGEISDASAVLFTVLEDCQRENYFKGVDKGQLYKIILGQLHGIASLYLSGRLKYVTREIMPGTLLNVISENFNQFWELSNINHDS